MPLPNPKRKRRYPFKRQLKRKLRRIAFMLIGAIVVSGINYYNKHKQAEQPIKSETINIEQ